MIVLLLVSVIVLSSDVLSTPEEKVTANLYGTVTLPCKFSFVNDLTDLRDLTVIWKMKNLIVYKLEREKEKEQDPRYTHRVRLSSGLKQGNLDLILKNVTHDDEGTYYCQAANNKGHVDKMVTLSIDNLDANLPTATLVTIDGKQRWKCRSSGVYHNPQVQWITKEGEDLSSYGGLNVTEESNGRKLVESVLDHDVEENAQILCHIKEGKLRRSARAVKSDGVHPITFDEL